MSSIFIKYGVMSSVGGLPAGVLYQDGVQGVPWEAGVSVGTDGLLSFGTANISLEAGYDGTNSTTNERAVVTTNTVDLTSYSTLHVEWDGQVTGGTSQTTNLIVSSSQLGGFNTFDARTQVLTIGFAGYQTDTLNVSALSGGYYIRINQRDSSTSSANGSRCFIKKVWLT
jgi:hypothetical protein